jgi:filamentous hemagglutinin family protein
MRKPPRFSSTFPDIPRFFCDKEDMRLFLPLALTLAGPALAQCPANSSPHFDCLSAGGNTQVTLFADAELSWDRFNVPSGGSLDISSAGGIFSSRHLTPGLLPTTIAGPITTDGPFTLVNSGGINITPTGSITAPTLTLSTLPALAQNTFQGTTRSRQMIVSGNLTATSGDLTLLAYQTTNNGSLSAPSGKVTLISTGSERVNTPLLTRTPTTAPARPLARATNRGALQAPVIEIYSEGFIENGGRIVGNRINLEALGIAHNNTPGSVIISPNLTLIPNTTLEGEVLNPGDGSNPGGISTTLGLPDLASGSFSGKKKTKLLPTQFSSSTVTLSRVPTAVSKRKKSSSRLATRGSTRKKSSSKKRSFFGVVTSK